MRVDRTTTILSRATRNAGAVTREVQLPSASRAFRLLLPRRWTDTGQDVVRAALEYFDGAAWQLIVGCSASGGERLDHDGSLAANSTAEILLQDTLHFPETDEYEVRSRSLPADTRVRLRLDVLSRINVEAVLEVEEGPSEVLRREKLHHSVAFDAASSSTGSFVSSVTFAHTCTGSDRGLVVGVSRYFSAVSGITYNGVAMASEGERADSQDGAASQRSLIAPATGANNVVVSCADDGRVVCGAVSVTGADQTDLCGTQVQAFGTGTTASLSVSSATGELVVDCVENNNYTDTPVVGAGQTQRWNTNVDGFLAGAGSTEPGAASVTMSWTYAGSEPWALVAVAVKAAAVATKSNRLPMMGVS